MSEYKIEFQNPFDAARAISSLYDYADSFMFEPERKLLSVRTDETNRKKINDIIIKFNGSEKA